LKEIKEECENRDLFLIEDATHALGASIDSKKVGTFGDASVFAFTPTKVLTTGEGGMLATNNDELYEFAQFYSYYGSGPGKTNFERLGRHMLMPEISAILGVHQLNCLDEFIDKRNQIAKIYNEAFNKFDGLSVVSCQKGNICSYYKYPLILDKKINKVNFLKTLKLNNVETGTVFYPPCHMQPVYQAQMYAWSLPNAEAVLSRTITLPLHLALTDLDICKVIEAIAIAALAI
jgi:dTDP-4-amino-4,6-dideoxygalactose transaminase